MRLTYDRVLVTGGMGFIGSHTVDALLQNEAEVWILDDLSSGRSRNLARWKNDTRLHFRRGTITKFRSVESLTRKVDAVIHLAAVVSPFISVTRPQTTNGVNVSGTLNVLQAALKNRIDRVVFASSSSVYGNTRSLLISEDAKLNPITPYGVSKLSAEKYCEVFSEQHDLNTISLRYFNAYGERQSSNPYSGVIAIFADRLAKARRPLIFGDGRQTRDFVHVSDVARANVLALHSKRGKGHSFNVGTGVATTISKLAQTLMDLTDRRDLAPIHQKSREGDIRNSCADVTKAQRILNFRARIPLKEGLGLLMNQQYRSVR